MDDREIENCFNVIELLLRDRGSAITGRTDEEIAAMRDVAECVVKDLHRIADALESLAFSAQTISRRVGDD